VPTANAERARRWREKNPDKVRAYAKRYEKDNRERRRLAALAEPASKKRSRSRAYSKRYPNKVRSAQRRWRLANKTRVKREYQDWVRRNPDKKRAYDAKRRALKLQTTQDSTGAIALRTAELCLLPCAVCGAEDRIEIDHIIPLARGGTHTCDNLQPLCKTCNCSKGAKTMEEFLAAA
jgi:5-methylcytosine-specific restriction endonuclease McrA